VVVTTILQALYDFLSQLVCWVMTALVLTLNLLLAALGALIATLIELLPEMDDASIPAVPSQVTTAASWVNWFFPVNQALLFFIFIFSAWVLWQAVAIAMRWAKALGE
jgi:hypothetical protein